jgi:hypothetical protein
MTEIDLTWVVGTVIVASGIFGGLIFQQQLRKDKRKTDTSTEAARASELAAETIEKATIVAERTLEKAAELQTRTEHIAQSVKEEMLGRVNGLLATLRAEIELERTKIYAEMSAREVKLDRIIKDFEEFRTHIYDKFKDFATSIERLQTMAWGVDAHSVPAYMMDSPKEPVSDSGVFKAQTSDESAEQQHQNIERISKEKKDKRESDAEE